MKLLKIAFHLILAIEITTTFSSCIGQNNIQKSKDSENTITHGRSVSELDQTIWVVFQDKKSNFWFGSKENGVFYYDGQSIKHFSKKDGLASNEIRGIQEDSLGNIFFETMAGICKYDGQKIKTLEIKGGESNKGEWKLVPNDLWFRNGFEKKGPYRYDGESLHYLEFPKSPQEDKFHIHHPDVSFSPYGIYSIYKDSKGFVWFGTSSLGLCRFDGKYVLWHYEDQLQKTPSGGDFGTRSIFEDKDGFFWINNSRYRYEILPNNSDGNNYINYKKENGIGYFNENNQIEFPYFLSIIQDNDGDIWMVTYDNGVWRNNGKELIHYSIKDNNTDVLLFSIYKDNQGDLWLGTHNAGVYKFNGMSFEKFEP